MLKFHGMCYRVNKKRVGPRVKIPRFDPCPRSRAAGRLIDRMRGASIAPFEKDLHLYCHLFWSHHGNQIPRSYVVSRRLLLHRITSFPCQTCARSLRMYSHGHSAIPIDPSSSISGNNAQKLDPLPSGYFDFLLFSTPPRSTGTPSWLLYRWLHS